MSNGDAPSANGKSLNRPVCLTVILPAGGIVAAMGWDASGVFPTRLLLVAAILAVVVAAGLCWRLWQPNLGWLTAAVFAYGYFVGASVSYSLLLSRLIPWIFLGMLVGIGVLGAAPYWATLGSVRLGRQLLSRVKGRLSRRRFAVALGVGCAVFPSLVWIESRFAAELVANIRRVADGETGASRRATALADLSSSDLVSRNHWDLAPRSRWIFWPSPSREDNERVSYLIEGVSPPAPPTFPDSGWSLMEVHGSWIRIGVEAAAALAVVDWTLELRSPRDLREEARIQFEIPPGSVASDLSLWMNGIESRAAFGPRERVRSSYEAIVEKSLDPALLEHAGKQKLQLSVFPVSREQSQRVRVELTVPLFVDGDQLLLRLPRILRSNVAVDVPHQVEVSSRSGIHAAVCEQTMTLPSRALAGSGFQVLEFPGTELATRVWALDKRGMCSQTLVRKEKRRGSSQPFLADEDPPETWILVIEGSRFAQQSLPPWEEFTAAWPRGTRFHAIFAGHRLEEFPTEDPSELREWLERLDFTGAVDNVPALRLAAERSRELDGAILWIAGEQSHQFAAVDGLRDSLASLTHPFLVWRLEPETCHLVHRDLEKSQSVIDILQFGDGWRGLSWALREPWDAAARRRCRGDVWAVIERSDWESGGGVEVDDSLVRLWAAQRASELQQKGDLAGATALAEHFRLVTEACAAVVLETKQQYVDFGLDPYAEDAFLDERPVPEPETWLILAGGLVLLCLRRQFAA